MNWDDVLQRLRSGGLSPVEKTYMENYGTILAVEDPRFSGRYFRCAYGAVECRGVRIDAFLFPSEGHREEFIEIAANDGSRWVSCANIALHLPEGDLRLLDSIATVIAT